MAATELDLRQQINDLWQSYEDAKKQNAAIQQKISQLEQAKSYVSKAKKSASSALKAVKKTSPSDDWKGSCRNQFENAQDVAISASAKSYYDNIDELESAISREIWNQRGQIDYLVGVMSGIEDGVDYLSRQLSELLSQED